MTEGPRKGKIFGIGLSRTGTTSLTEALRILGYSAIHFPWRFSEIDGVDAATDTPVALKYAELDKRYPGSRFILTHRDRIAWLRSCQKFWRKNAEDFAAVPAFVDLHTKLYGGPTFSRKRFGEAYDRHVDGVNAFFRDRPADLLVIDIAREDDPWRPLAAFLEADIPETPFPRQNRSDIVDAILRHLLSTFSAERVAGMANVAEEYVEELAGRSGAAPAIVLDGGYEADSIIRHVVRTLGITEAAQVLDVPLAELNGALERH